MEAAPRIELGIKVLQTSALPLGYAAIWSGKRDSNPRPPPWQGGALPLSYFRKQQRYHYIIASGFVKQILEFFSSAGLVQRPRWLVYHRAFAVSRTHFKFFSVLSIHLALSTLTCFIIPEDGAPRKQKSRTMPASVRQSSKSARSAPKTFICRGKRESRRGVKYPRYRAVVLSPSGDSLLALP